jgi:hypothetical protein
MNLLDTILNANNGQVVGELAKKFNLDEKQASKALNTLLPSLSRGVQNNISSSDGLDSLIGALTKGTHAQYLDAPGSLDSVSAITDGNSILGHIFGNKDVSRNVAAHASKETGIDYTVLKKMLPIIAAAAMGALSKETTEKGLLESFVSKESPSSNSNTSMLTSFLDSDNDGSVVDDVLQMATKLF